MLPNSGEKICRRPYIIGVCVPKYANVLAYFLEMSSDTKSQYSFTINMEVQYVRA